MKPTYIKADYTQSATFNNESRPVYGTSGIGSVRGPVEESESIDTFDMKLDYSSEAMKRSLYKSSETLGPDYIDLLFLHGRTKRSADQINDGRLGIGQTAGETILRNQ